MGSGEPTKHSSASGFSEVSGTPKFTSAVGASKAVEAGVRQFPKKCVSLLSRWRFEITVDTPIDKIGGQYPIQKSGNFFLQKMVNETLKKNQLSQNYTWLAYKAPSQVMVNTLLNHN